MRLWNKPGERLRRGVSEASRQRFLSAQGYDAKHGWGLTALPSDASSRRYFRLSGADGATRMVMDMQAEASRVPIFIRLAQHLRSLGLSAPSVERVDERCGLVLLEDFGDTTFTRALDCGTDAWELYRLAVEVLVHLHAQPQAMAIAVPAYDMTLLLDEVALYADWYVPAFAPGHGDDFRVRFLDLWRQALNEVAQRRDVLVLRDFHVDNLMVVADRKGSARCGVLDFQDAVLGSAAYDVVSLLQDARRDLPLGLEVDLLTHYLGRREDLDAVVFRHDYALLAAQRHAKVLGIFVRLARRDGKSGYLRHLERVAGLFERALVAAGLDRLRDFLDSTLPQRAPIAAHQKDWSTAPQRQ